MHYDLVVIGSGPGGYVAAIKAAQLGFKTAVIEKRKTFGGTCLNVGCIPSKALLYASELYEKTLHAFPTLGIDIKKPSLNLQKMMLHKQKTIDANVNGISFLFKKNKIDSYIGCGTILNDHEIRLTLNNGETKQIEGKNIIIATGSEVAPIPGLNIEIDEEKILSSTGALNLSSVPKTMTVIGGGVIGLELGSVWSRLGSKVTIIEYSDQILANFDRELGKNFQKMAEKNGLSFCVNSQVTSIQRKESTVSVSFKSTKDPKASEKMDVNCVLIATGRRPYTEGLGLEAIGIKLDEHGRIPINDHWQTDLKSIYAIGDVVKGPMLAHKAEEEGIAVVEQLAGQISHVNYNVIPSVVYTDPEIASVGKTEEELKLEKVAYKVGKFPFLANGRARSMLQTDGFVKILADQKTDKVLGAHIIGPSAGEIIHEIAVLIEFGGSSEDLARVCHAHPTVSEAVREAALMTFDKAIHI